MTDLNSESPPPLKPTVSGRLIMLGLVLGAILTPIAAFLFMQVFDHFDPLCGGDGGAEASLSCVLRQVAVTGLAIVPGAMIGFLVAYRYGARRNSKRG